MADSLREQLLKSGIVKQTRKDQPARRKQGGSNRHHDKDGRDEEMDLAHAWAMRASVESTERKRAKAQAEAAARERKERLQRLRKVLDGKALNKPEAERVRHFEYGGKIRRVYVDDTQLEALNEGRLGVVQLKGGYILATREVVQEVQAFAPGHVALLVNPDAPQADDGIPGDSSW